MELVIDTSAILAVITEQPEKAALIRLTRGASLLAPPSVHWEIGNAISAMFKRRELDLGRGLKLLETYAAIPIRVSNVTLAQAVELSAQLRIFAYDAYIIACALNVRAPILTLDRSLAERARSLQLEVPEVSVS